MNPNCKECGKCCLNTEMILSHSDIMNIYKISPDNLLQEDFTNLNEDNLLQMINVNGNCFFFNIKTKTCKIYENRPQGCIFYPLIYDFTKEKCILDDDCPRTHLFYQDANLKREVCKNLKKFLREDLNISI